ncbi:MAG TPA: carboxypeptidase regulatory-like domain-containing protein [Bacteroidota bacterium]|nr:carboxypeptidase regulatory-like domain-containing protein [Bacteroidota bacterium]
MKTRALILSLSAAFIFLFVAAGNSRIGSKADNSKNTVMTTNGRTVSRTSTRDSSLRALREASQKFDRQVQTLRKIHRGRVLAKKIHEASVRARQKAKARKAAAVQTSKRVTIFGRPTKFFTAPKVHNPAKAGSGMRVLTSSLFLNGVANDTINVGDPITLTFCFSPNAISASMSIYLDADGDGMLSAQDVLIQERMLLMDNDDNDYDPSQGNYRTTIQTGEFPAIGNFIVVVNDYQSVATATLTVKPATGSSVLLGTVVPATPNVAIIAYDADEQVAFTDSSGKFALYFSGLESTGIDLFADAFTGNLSEYLPPHDRVINLWGDTTVVNLVYTVAPALIEGYVRDQTGAAVSRASIVAEMNNTPSSPPTIAYSDSNGYYKIGASKGTWTLYVEVQWSNDYFGENSCTVPVQASGAINKDISIIKATGAISGNITLGQSGIGGVPISAQSDTLPNSSVSSSNGSYSIPVDTASSQLYIVTPSLPPGYLLTTTPPIVKAGAVNVNLVVKKVLGGIRGFVTDSKTKAPVSGASISVYGSSAYVTAVSNDSGYYQMSLSDGSYSVDVSSSYYYGASASASIFGGIQRIDFPMVRGGSFSGTITDNGGRPILDADVIAFDSAGLEVSTGWSGGSGKFTIGPLNTGKYFAYTQAEGYVRQWYHQASTLATATPIQTVQGYNTPNIDFALSLGGSISGSVVDRQGKVIPNVQVVVYDSLSVWQSFAFSDDSGYYKATGLMTGHYFVSAVASSYLDQWYNGASSFADATPVSVTTDQNTGNINFILVRGGVITGTTQSRKNELLSGTEVFATNQLGSFIAYAVTDDTGHYEVGGLPPATDIYLEAEKDGYADWWYNNVSTRDSATAIDLGIEETRNNIDFKMPLGSTVMGKVLDSYGRAISGAYVGIQNGSCYKMGTSNLTGNYTVPGLSPGIYLASAYAPGFTTQWYNHKNSWQSPDSIHVSAESVVRNINFNLSEGAGISGTAIDDSTIARIAGIKIVAASVDGGIQEFTETDDEGFYFLALPSGTYVLRASDPEHRYAGQFYSRTGGVPLQQCSEQIIVNDNAQNPAANFSLRRRCPYASLVTSNLGMTITNTGQFGYNTVDTTQPSGRWPNLSSPNYLFEGDLWVGGLIDNDTVVSGGAYEGPDFTTWTPLSNFSHLTRSSVCGLRTYFTDMDNERLDDISHLVVRSDNYGPKMSDFTIHKFTIYYEPGFGPYSQQNINDAYIGLAFDFDVSQYGAHDKVGIDKNNFLIYMYDSTAPEGVTMGVRLLDRRPARMTWWVNPDDPITDDGRYTAMKKDTCTSVCDLAGDYRVLTSAGPFTLKPGDSVTVAIAVVAGNGASAVTAAAISAQTLYDSENKFNDPTGVQSTSQLVPQEFKLEQNYPNPFNPSTSIQFEIPGSAHITLKVYNVLGQEVASLVDDTRPAGKYTVQWNASSVASGVYFYTLRTGSFVQTRKMLLLK